MRTFIVVTIFFLNLCGVRAETSLAAATSPTKIVTDLYSAHRGKADPLQYPASKKLLGAYFEKGLLSLFLKDQSESQGEVGKPLRGLANRVDQATTNFLETFPLFATVVLAAHITSRHSLLTLWGAHLYFWARVGYLLAAAAGYSLVRSVALLEYSGYRYITFPHCASLVVI
jgi:uncharacterized MAPEG superfamily protein